MTSGIAPSIRYLMMAFWLGRADLGMGGGGCKLFPAAAAAGEGLDEGESRLRAAVLSLVKSKLCSVTASWTWNGVICSLKISRCLIRNN